MVKDELVITKARRDAGWHLLRSAQQANIPVLGLFWGQFEENDWRLFFVVPATQDTKETYYWLRSVLPSDAEAEQADDYLLTSTDIAVIGPQLRIVQDVRNWARARYGTEDGSVTDDERIVRGASLTSEDAYIYYLAPEK